MPTKHELLTLVYWYIDFLDGELVHPTIPLNQLQGLSLMMMTHILPNLDTDHAIPEPPADLTFQGLYDRIAQTPLPPGEL